MSDNSVKMVILLKKKRGMSFEEFRGYYENKHSKLITLLPRVTKYLRRYLHPLRARLDLDEGGNEADEYSVITEIWWKHKEDFDYAMRCLESPDVVGVFAADEKNLFEVDMIKRYVVEECYSDLT